MQSRFFRQLALFTAVLLLSVSQAVAHFAVEITEDVPIDRLLANLEAKYTNNPQSIEVLYDLARMHSMAYSTNRSTYPLNQTTKRPAFNFFLFTDVPSQVHAPTNAQTRAAALQHLTNAIKFYQLAANLVMTGTNRTNHQWLVGPIHLGYAWTLDQDGRRKEAIKAYRRALVLVWDIEIEPHPSLRQQLDWSWDKIRKQQTPFSKPPKYLGTGVCCSQETIGYLLKLLDPKKDAAEISQLNADLKTIQGMGRIITPILVGLNPQVPFEQLVNPGAQVAFDLDGSGLPRRWGWLTTNAAWLVFDPRHEGRINSGLQLFGNVTFWVFWRDGYAALSSLDDNADGRLAGGELDSLALWCDANSNGISDPGEVRPLSELGITALRCDSQTHETGIPFNSNGVELSDGTTLPTYDWITPGR